jgi:endonuclease/exonuclease/phosphatase family metal-dependent hydrolase
MTFNIRGALYEDGLNHWRRRCPLNLQTIQRHAPDLVGFQEAHLENLDVYRRHLAGYAFEQGIPYNNQEPFQYTSIAWNTQRLQCLEMGGFWLSETPEQHSASWDTACVRSGTWARLAWLPTGITFLHLNTHLDHVSELARLEGSRLIVERLAALAGANLPGKSLPVIITGDFNCEPDSPAYRLFVENDFMDASANVNVPTFHNFQGAAFEPWPGVSGRIDWILLRGWGLNARLQDCRALLDAEPPIYPSDHYPLIADLSLS